MFDSQSPLHQDLLTIIDQVDQQVSAENPKCEVSGRCCRFREYGHRLYLTQPEAEYLFSVPWEETSEAQPGLCPYQVKGLCTARERRPLGCRIFFCDPNYEETMIEITESSLTQLKQAHQQHNVPYCYANLDWFLEQQKGTDPSSNQS